MPYFVAREACSWGLSTRIAPSRTHLCHQPFSLRQMLASANAVKARVAFFFSPQALEHAEHMLHPRPNTGLVAIFATGFFMKDSMALVGEVFGLDCFAVVQLLLAGIGCSTATYQSSAGALLSSHRRASKALAASLPITGEASSISLPLSSSSLNGSSGSPLRLG